MSELANLSNQLALIQLSIGRIEEKVSGLPELQRRVAKLESWRTWVLGLVAGIGAVLGYQAKGHL